MGGARLLPEVPNCMYMHFYYCSKHTGAEFLKARILSRNRHLDCACLSSYSTVRSTNIQPDIPMSYCPVAVAVMKSKRYLDPQSPSHQRRDISKHPRLKLFPSRLILMAFHFRNSQLSTTHTRVVLVY